MDTESMSNAIRNANCGEKDSTGDAYSPFLAKISNLKMRKIASKYKCPGELLMVFKGLTQKEQT